MKKDAGSKFIDDNFEPDDRLAVVLIDRRSGAVTQRIAPAKQIASPEFQVWLRDRNRMGADVFVSMNALAADARGRTKADVAEIRHLYLDFDENGTEAVKRLQSREDMPKPNYVVNTSPDHWQVSWKVHGFGKEEAETVMRELVHEFGADPAATDSSRVMRIPGFVNHKRHPTHRVREDQLSTVIYTPEHFPRFAQDDRRASSPAGRLSSDSREARRGRLSQSELDWAYAKRALARGESPDAVVAAIADFRAGEKSDPRYYARTTVEKAAKALGQSSQPVNTHEPSR